MNIGQFFANLYIQMLGLQTEQAVGIAGMLGVYTMLVLFAIGAGALTWVANRFVKHTQQDRNSF